MAGQELNWDIVAYDCNFVDPPPNDFICPACNNILKKPTLTDCCGKHYCAWCLSSQDDAKNAKPFCHHCEKYCQYTIMDKIKWSKILELDVTCPFSNRGCLWTGELGERSTHLTGNCDFIDVDCTNECGEHLVKNELAEHIEFLCPRRVTACPYCKESGEYEMIFGKHKEECLDFRVYCPNNCGKDLKQRFLKQHLSECPKAAVECNYRYAGCMEVVQRKDLENHLQLNSNKHLLLNAAFFMQEFQKKDELIENLREANEQQLQELCTLHKQELSDRTQKHGELQKMSSKTFGDEIVRLKHDFTSLELETNKLLYGSLEINREELTFSEPLSGSYNSWKGTYIERQVVIKSRLILTPTDNDCTEAITLMKLKHQNIIGILAVIPSGNPLLIILEYMSSGNLQQYLRNNAITILLHHQITICKQVALGLEYIQNNLYVHRNIKAKSILLGEGLLCKIGNFKMVKPLNHNKDEYIASKSEKVSVRWCAPEALQEQRFSLKSDVWSFGILMYEVVTCGSVPYPNQTNIEAVSRIHTMDTMQKPTSCPEKFYNLMEDCWTQDPWVRPTFEALTDLLDHVKDTHDYAEIQ